MSAIPQAALELLEQELLGDEGERLFVYDDATGRPVGKGSTLIGNPTIGVGRCLSTRGITRAESRALLGNDEAAAWSELSALLPWLPLETPARIAAILSLYFNEGLGNPSHFARSWPHLLEQLQAHEYSDAADNLETSQPWARQVGPRAARLANMIRKG